MKSIVKGYNTMQLQIVSETKYHKRCTTTQLSQDCTSSSLSLFFEHIKPLKNRLLFLPNKKADCDNNDKLELDL